MVEQKISPEQLKRLQTLWGLHWKAVGSEWPASIASRFSSGAELCRTARLGWIAGVVGRQLESAKELTRQEAGGVLDALAKLVPAHLVTKRRRGGREISHARGTAGRRGTPASKEIILPGAEDWAKLEAVMRRIEFDQARLAAFLRARTSPLRGREKIYSLADLNKVLWALEGIERRGAKKQNLKREVPAEVVHA